MKTFPPQPRAGLFSLLILALGLAFSGCDKEKMSPTEPETLLVGRWRLRQTSGGIAGGTRPADPNRQQELLFTADGQAQLLLNGAVQVSTGYTLRQVDLALTGQRETLLNMGAPLSSFRAEWIIRQLTATELSLQEPYADGLQYDYVR